MAYIYLCKSLNIILDSSLKEIQLRMFSDNVAQYPGGFDEGLVDSVWDYIPAT